MRYRATHHTNHVLDTDFGEVEIQYSADSACYDGALAHREGDHLVVAYLSHDDDCQNPLENCEGMGKIIGRGRYQTRNHSEQDLFGALGLDSNGDPNYELVGDEVNAAWKTYIESVPDDVWEAFVDDIGFTRGGFDRSEYINKWRDQLMDVDPYHEGDVRYCVMEAEKYVYGDFDASNDQCAKASANLTFDVEKVTHDLWVKAREEGRIGDCDAVMLDVYDHSGLHWSISGGGMQCRWDTSSGAGVWVPDDEARSEIDRRASVYAVNYIRETPLRMHGKDNKYQLIDVDTNNSIAMSDNWGDLWAMAQKYAEAAGDLPPTQLAIGRHYAALELAQNALDEYNAWLSGDCHGVIVEEFKNVAEPGDEPVWEQTDDDACWGYVGGDYAKEEMTSQFESAVKRLQNVTVTNV